MSKNKKIVSVNLKSITLRLEQHICQGDENINGKTHLPRVTYKLRTYWIERKRGKRLVHTKENAFL